MNTVVLKRTLVRWEVKETVLILGMSVILPFIIHLLPPIGGMPAGLRFLAMFYAPFIAVLLFRPHVAIITALLSPSLNLHLTGLPAPEIVGILTVELAMFSVIAYLIQKKWRNFWGTALLAYLAAVLSVSFLLSSTGPLLSALVNSLPGLLILVLLNIFLLRFRNERDKF